MTDVTGIEYTTGPGNPKPTHPFDKTDAQLEADAAVQAAYARHLDYIAITFDVGIEPNWGHLQDLEEDAIAAERRRDMVNAAENRRAAAISIAQLQEV